MKRLLRVYAEVFDEDTGLVSVAPLADNAPWPPPLDEVRRTDQAHGVSSRSSIQDRTDTVAARGPAEQTIAAEAVAESGESAEAGAESGAEAGAESGVESGVGSGVESGIESGVESGVGIESEVGSGVESGIESGVGSGVKNDARSDKPPGSGEPPVLTPTYMTELVEPKGEPMVNDDDDLSFEVVDDPAALKLAWDDGVTEKNRRMHMAPFADGMWAVLENDGEYLVYLRRGKLKATEFEAQSSLKEAKALASMLSKRWMGETQGDTLLQKLAATNARDFVRWVGLSLSFDGDDYHFRRGRVRRQQTTTTVTYVGAKERGKEKGEMGGRQRIEVRLTPTKTGSTLAVWALWYGSDSKIVGSFFEADHPRERLAELRKVRFGPAPGKRLRWVKISGREEQAEWGRHVLVIQHSRRLAVLALRNKGGDIILCCGDAGDLKALALNSLVRYLRRHSRKEPARPIADEQPPREPVTAVVPALSPELSPEPEVANEPEAAPEAEPERHPELEAEPESESSQESKPKRPAPKSEVSPESKPRRPAPKPEPEQESKPRRPAPEPEPESRPSAPDEERELPRLTKTMKTALKKLAKVPGGDASAVFSKIHWKTRKGLIANGLATEDGRLTALGQELSGVAASSPESTVRPQREPAPVEEDDIDDDDDDDDDIDDDADDDDDDADADADDDDDDDDNALEVTPEQARAIENSMGSAVDEMRSRMPPLPPE